MRIIALPLYGIGDVLMSTPALKNIKEKLNAHVTFLHMFESTRDMLMNNPNIDENIHFPFLSAGKMESVRFLFKLRNRYDASVNFYPTNRSQYNLAAYLINSPMRIGHRYRLYDIRELNFLKNKTVMEDDALHNVEENLRLLGFLGIDNPERSPMRIYPTDGEIKKADRWIADNIKRGPIIGMHPGTSAFKDQFKRRWPPENFARLAELILSRVKAAEILVFCGPDEQGTARIIKSDALGGDYSESVHFPTGTLRDMAGLISRCNAFVSNDSGLMHIASAFNVPTVALFGPTNPAWVRPWMTPNVVLTHCMRCGPCFRYSPRPLRCDSGLDFKCINEIKVEDALDALMSLMNQP